MVAQEIDQPTEAYNKYLNTNNRSLFIFLDYKSADCVSRGYGILNSNAHSNKVNKKNQKGFGKSHCCSGPSEYF
jgi:hypothetical protein